ncbi:MAG: hypothetical protein AAGI91_11220 [Bacteroidota bacterium]
MSNRLLGRNAPLRASWLALPLLLAAVPVLASFTERYYFEVPLERETRLEADLELALGRVAVGKAEEGYLFQAEIALEEDDMVPELEVAYEDGTAHVDLGLDSGSKDDGGITVRGIRIPEDNEWLLFLSDRVPLDLAFELGMAEADLDLSGFQVERLSIESGMAKTRLAFDTPNPVVMDDLEVEAGMATFDTHRLGNARFERFSFDGGAGSFGLDFTGGPLPPGARADIEVGMASVRIALPEGAPVILHASDSWLAQVEIPDGYIKRSKGRWHSPQVEDEDDAFHVRVEAGVGKVTCQTGPFSD